MLTVQKKRTAKRSAKSGVQGWQPKRARLERYKGDQTFQRLQVKCEKRSIAISQQLELEESVEPVKPVEPTSDPFYYTSKNEQQRLLGGFALEGILKKLHSRAMVNMSEHTLRHLSRELREAIWEKKSFCVAVECTREEALAKGELGGFKHGENGSGHFYFEPNSGDFTDEQIEWIQDHTACCYQQGQPCAQQLDDEWDGDPCECAMGNANGSSCYQMGIGPDTFEEECNCFAIKPICSKIETGVHTEYIHTVEQFKESVGDLTSLDADALVKVSLFLQSSMQNELRYGSIVYKPYTVQAPTPPTPPTPPAPPPTPPPPTPPTPPTQAHSDYKNLFRVDKARQTQMLGGYTLERVLNFISSRVLKDMSIDTLQEVSHELRQARWRKKAFCYHCECTREEAIAKGELGGYVAGELGTHYFFFEPKSSVFTDDQRQKIRDHTACCFMQGQPCGAQSRDDDPCTHKMGNDNGSFWFKMNLGPSTFRSECDVELIQPKWVRSFQSGDFSAVDNIYSMDDLKQEFDLNNVDIDQLVKIAAFLKNPIELSVEQTIAGMRGISIYKPYHK